MSKTVLKKRAIGTRLVLALLILATIIPFALTTNAVESVKLESVAEETGVEVLPPNKEDAARVEEMLQSEEDTQYYAYLDLEAAEETIRPVILEARNRIIFRQSWVADGVSGRIRDKDGNIKAELPQFSELFPADWDEPVLLGSAVDLSYYAKPSEQ